MDNKIPHILIVDDDSNLLTTMSDILKLKGFEPVIAQTGRAALAQLEKHWFDLALIDLRLEDMSGLKVLSAIKERSSETECILLTGHASQNSAIEAIQMGVYGYFQKPFEMEHVLLSIQHVLEKKATGKALRESERFAHATVDALSSHLAILDEAGVILAVNRAWREFAEANSTEALGSNVNVYEGANYLSVCEASVGKNSEEASAMVAGIRAVMSGRQKEFSLEYPCHSSDEQRWFNAHVTCFPGAGALRIVVAHENITVRKLAEDAQRKSELQFRALFELSPDAVVLIDPHDPNISWPIIDCNAAACLMNGYSREELIGQSVDILNTTPGKQAERNAYVKRLREAGNLQLETFHRRKNGVIFPIEVSTAFIKIGERELLLGIDRDITERKQAEEKIAQTEKHFRSLIENAPDGIVLIGMDGKYKYASPAAVRIFGYNMEDVVGMNPAEQTHPEDLPMVLELLQELIAKPSHAPTIQYRFKHQDNSWRWVESAFTNLLAEPSVEAIVINFRDITERKQTENTLYSSEENLRKAQQYAHLGNWTWNIKTNQLTWSDEMYRIFGIDKESFTGKLADVITRAIHPDDREKVESANRNVIEKGIPVPLEYRIVLQDGTMRVVWAEAGEFVLDAAGNPAFLSGIVQDITERKGAEEKLVSSELRYRRLFEASKDGILILDADTGIVLNVNPFLVEMLGISQEELLGKGLWELGFFKDIAANKANFLELQQNEYIRYEDLPLETAQGRRLNVEFVSNVYQVNRHKVVQCNIRDITERKQSEKLLRQQSEQLRLLYETSQQLNRTLDLHEIYQAICDFMSIVAPNDGLVISAFDPETQTIACRAYWMDNDWLDVSGFPPIPLEAEGKGTQSIAIRTGQSMLINDYQAQVKTAQTSYYVNSEEVVKELSPEDEEITRSALIVPLKMRGAVHGVIQVMSYRLNAYTENQLKLLEALALHIASAEQNALLYAQVQAELNERKRSEENIHQRINELELLYESGLAFSQLLNPKEIAQKIIELLEEKLDWHHTAIRLLRAQDQGLELVAFAQAGLETKATEAHLSKFITRFGEGLSGWALKQSKIIRTGDVSHDPHYIASYPGMNSGLYVPLKSGDHLLGVISIESEQPNAFSEADEQLLTTLANQAANAFENARLYKETIIHAQELEQRVQERTADLNHVNIDLANAVRVKDEFLASMSHELRTPLTGILGLSEVLQLRVYGELNDKQSKTLKTIEESGRHLLDLINDILDLSKIEAGKFELQVRPYSLSDICQASLQLIKGMAQHKNQHVHYSPPTTPILVYVDARRLKQMLVNLLSNAIKFTPENGELGLEVQANESERKFTLTVWDKGIGIKSEDLHKLFKPFVQLDSGLAREYSGTGLGLALVKHLTELHNGGIEVESKFREGSRFTIILPWSPQNTTPIPYIMQRGNTGGLRQPAMSSENSKSPLVMYVDDNEMVLQMVADFLEAKQYRVMKVRSGAELLEQVTEFHPDILLVDIQMPGIGGMETIRRIRSHSDPLVAAAPVIAVTALAMPADRERCLQAGANDYMSKPLKLKELDAAIQNLLKRKQ